jgi:hypothetical protein
MSSVYFPRAVVRISLTAYTDMKKGSEATATFDAVPRSVSWERNPYLEADTASVEFYTDRFPFLPRNIKQALISVFAADVGTLDADAASIINEHNLRFIGYIDDPELALTAEDGTVKMKARDYTALFLDAKRPLASQVPSYSDRLDTAILRVMRGIPGNENMQSLKLKLGPDMTEWPSLSSGAPSRMHGEKLPWKGEDSKWDLIKRACEICNVIPRMVLDTLIVSKAQGLTTTGKKPHLIFGRNVEEYREKKNLKRLNEGIGLRAYNATTHQFITAVYPPEGDRLITKSVRGPKPKKAPPAPPIAGSQDKRKWHTFEPVSSLDQLEEAAKLVFELRRIQDFESTLKVKRMRVATDASGIETSDADAYDMTGLESGDTCVIDVDPKSRALLKGFTTRDARVTALIHHGYSTEAAELSVQIFEGSTSGPIEMYTRKATHTIDENGYACDIELMNKIDR